jgi:hypothetical protein
MERVGIAPHHHPDEYGKEGLDRLAEALNRARIHRQESDRSGTLDEPAAHEINLPLRLREFPRVSSFA